MKIFLDTASAAEIRKANDMLPLDGITTNPTLIMKEGRDYNEALREICSIVKGPVSAETVSSDAEGMVKEGLEFSKIAKNIIIKVVLTPEGLRACRMLAEKGIKTNVTLCFSANQALLAAKSGAFIVSPFVGRLDDIGQPGMMLIQDIKTIYANYGFKTQILVASIRNPIHVHESAKIGADIATMPFSVLEQLFRHSLTDAGIKKFLDDWSKVPKKKR
ncbi:fructose-6-phosphate aldolase [Candidatus Woesearchaeota archaeon]|nr:fructose-6-phosphate aldolase [Candidatus Woesearchaeota archaeon]MBI2661030.1 fructose-6-phosphate aldolase [Candidatus Woesearchaeota archaeon]